MKVVIASDHAAYLTKEQIKLYLDDKKIETVDFGTHSIDSMDYPDTIAPAARAVAKGDFDFGIVLCGSGIGASIVANKVRGVRAALVLDEYSAEYSRRHNNANVIVLAGRRRTMDDIGRYLDIWFETPYDGGRHDRRIEKIARLEQEECGD
ncbi:MAG: ribose 5-phosphate isomerase B [Spirochaetes bacterium GWF1_51_8]|nr:MAG: ribose 5-phosphate isomerase B [Spirochaetes bacterium GWF1_51_8]